MVWNALCVIGVLLIINGLLMIQQGRILSNVRTSMGNSEEIVCGTTKGLLFLTSTDIMLGVDRKGFIKKAFKIRSGYLRKTKAEALSIEGKKVEELKVNELFQKSGEQKACALAMKQYRNQKAGRRKG